MMSGTIIMYAVAVLAVVTGMTLLARLRFAGLGEPARYAHRIAGTMALMLGLFLAGFATVFWQAAAATPSHLFVPE